MYVHVIADLVDFVPVDVTVELCVEVVQHAHHVHWLTPGDEVREGGRR